MRVAPRRKWPRDPQVGADPEAFIAKVVHSLDESLHGLPRLAFAHRSPVAPFLLNLVARQGLAEYGDQRAIA